MPTATTNKNKIFDVLIADHDRHRKLLDQIEQTVGESQERIDLFTEFALDAKAHATSEEQALYSTMLAKPKLTEKGRHSTSEHKEIEDLINELAELDMSTGGWLIKFKSLKEEYLHHIKEEEDEIFPAAEKELDASDEKRMAEIFKNRKPIEKNKATVGKDEKED